MTIDGPLVAYAFGAGMLATVNPCGYAMLPAYLSYYLATEEAQPGDRRQQGGAAGSSAAASLRRPGTLVPRLLRAILVGGVLTGGFPLLFAVAGSLISLGAHVLVGFMPWIGLLVGVGLVLVGGWLLLGRHLPLPALPFLQASRSRTLAGIFAFGVAYGLASLSCTLPIFLVAVAGAFTRSGVAAGMAGFLSYGLGMGVVLLALTVSLALFREALLRHLRRLLPYVERIGAVLVIGAGLYIIYYWLNAGRLLYRGS